MGYFMRELEFKFRPQLIAMRDFGHKITGNDKWIEEYEAISFTLLYYSDYAKDFENNKDKGKQILDAYYEWEESSYCPNEYGGLSMSSYNQYRSRRAKNKKKVEEGRKLLKKFNLTMIKSREEERQLTNQLYRYRG